MARFRTLLVDDDKIVLSYLLGLVRWEEHGFEVVGTAANGRQGLAKCRELSPAIVFLDVQMPVMDGLDVLKEAARAQMASRFVVLTAYDEFAYAREAMNQGAIGYLLKDELSCDALVGFLRKTHQALEGERRACELLIAHLVNQCTGQAPFCADEIKSELTRALRELAALSDTQTLKTAVGDICAHVQEGYRALGKAGYFAPPEWSDAVQFSNWLSEQVEMFSGWQVERAQGTPPVISHARAYIDRHYADKDLNIQQIARAVGLSPNRLSTLFRNQTGQTINTYVTSRRIERAKELLLQGHHKVFEVADQVGYGSSQYFSKVFCQLTGHTPQAYRGGDAT